MRRKSRESANIRPSSAEPRWPRTWRKVRIPLPTPYQPGTKCRFCDQANTQGIARRSLSDWAPNRRAGREPMLSRVSSSSGLAAW